MPENDINIVTFVFVAEAAPMINEFGLQKQESICDISRCELYQGKHGDAEVSLITNGKCPVFGCDEVCNRVLYSCYQVISKYLLGWNSGGSSQHVYCRAAPTT